MIFNLVGIGELFIAFAVGFLFFGDNSGFTFAGFLWIAMDLLYRFTRKDEYEDIPYWSPRRGGQIFFIPGWICGIGVFLLGLFGG